jgi:hypothetical protein
MVKSRAFLFKIENYEENDWINVCNIKNTQNNEYIVAHSKNKSINGFIRFTNPKHLNSVITLFNNKATVNVEQNNDLYYKELFTKNEKHIEYGTPAKQKQRSKNCILELLAKKDEQIDKLIQTFQDCKTGDTEKLKQITDFCLTLAKNSPSITNNTINNKNKFNLNIFLNETCKNAVNLIDFVRGIQIEIQDLILYTKFGHADAVTKIFDNAYKKLDPEMRPVHCTDIKRETLYVRDENKWLNDENKEMSERALKIISTKSLNQMTNWKDANPDYQSSQEKKIEYMKLMKNVLGTYSDSEEITQTKRMIRNLSQIAQLDKEQQQIM